MRARIFRLVTALTLAAVILTACGSSTPQSSPGFRAGIELHLSLASTSVQPGGTIHGTLTVFNQTGSPTPVGCDHQWFYVALTSPEVPAPADFNDPICRPVTTLQVGETRFPVSVVASYSSCGFGAGVTTSTPECLRSARCQPAGSRCGLGMPSLPPGIYRTKFVFMGVSPSEVQRPPTITVNVQ